MKKFLLLVLSLAFISTFSTEVDAQAKKYMLFEDFSQASCPPCAPYNLVFEPYYESVKVNAHQVVFHTWWPGVDEMFDYNDPENRAQIVYHGVTAAPNMVANGVNIGSGVAAAIDPALIDNVGTSPIRVKVEEELVGNTMTGTVTVEVLAAVNASNYVLRVAAIEESINYTISPGSNGETHFPNVFRRFIANGQAGEPIMLEMGQSVTLDYSYDMDDAVWVADEMYTLAWVSDEATREVLNSGRANDVSLSLANTTPRTFVKGDAAGNSFVGEVDNFGDEPVDITINFDTDQPADWNASYNFMGTDYTDTQTFTVMPGTMPLTINATAGSMAGIGEYIATVVTPGNLEQRVRYSMISGVTDLVVHRNSPDIDLRAPGTEGLAHAANTAFAAIDDGSIIDALSDGTLEGVDHVYYNVGWTFPAIPANLAAALSAYIDNGGNLMLSGQDIGWDINDANGNSTGAAQSAFYTDYLNTIYIDDGDATRTNIIGITTDGVFGLSGASPVTRPYGATAIFPDRLAPANATAQAIFHYNNAAETAGIRGRVGDSKIVYLGIGIEQFGSVAVRNEVVKLTHDWFHGALSDTEFDNAMAALSMGQSFPNPANAQVIVPFNGVADKDMMLRITDLNGRLIETQDVTNGTEQIKINTSSFAEGTYFYQLTDGINLGTPKKFVVTH